MIGIQEFLHSIIDSCKTYGVTPKKISMNYKLYDELRKSLKEGKVIIPPSVDLSKYAGLDIEVTPSHKTDILVMVEAEIV